MESGFDVDLPDGTFYIFPKSPIADDIEFVALLQRHFILAVPGAGFGRRGYFRLAYCTEMSVIERSREAFMKVGRLYRQA